ncbi:PEP-CTERM sorting domain-containing protein [Dechloromonas sp. HYN0024]|nr:PEP-CTERM sorting domain-containing protein [Dechloromonas sp. HYN0024]
MSGGRVVLNNFFALTALTGAGTSAYTNAANAGNFTNGMKNSWGGNAAGWTTDNVVGTAADFYTVTAATSAAGGTLVASGITFDGTTVAVAAVPEPETYSMLAAGLLMLGAVARRRKA